MAALSRSMHKQAEYKRQNLYAWLFIFAQVAIFIGLIFFFFLSPVRVNGQSMSPMLQEGDILLIDKLTYHLRSPKRGDMVIFPHPETGEELIKRVIAFAGETVEITEGRVYINGVYLDESSYLEAAPDLDFRSTVVEINTIFVLGDERNMSLDSRDLGGVALRSIDGLVRFRVAPLNRTNIFL